MHYVVCFVQNTGICITRRRTCVLRAACCVPRDGVTEYCSVLSVLRAPCSVLLSTHTDMTLEQGFTWGARLAGVVAAHVPHVCPPLDWDPLGSRPWARPLMSIIRWKTRIKNQTPKKTRTTKTIKTAQKTKRTKTDQKVKGPCPNCRSRSRMGQAENPSLAPLTRKEELSLCRCITRSIAGRECFFNQNNMHSKGDALTRKRRELLALLYRCTLYGNNNLNLLTGPGKACLPPRQAETDRSLLPLLLFSLKSPQALPC